MPVDPLTLRCLRKNPHRCPLCGRLAQVTLKFNADEYVTLLECVTCGRKYRAVLRIERAEELKD